MSYKAILLTSTIPSTRCKKNHHYQLKEVVVVGDDPDSEINAANSSQQDAVLFDKLNLHPEVTTNQRVTDFDELYALINK